MIALVIAISGVGFSCTRRNSVTPTMSLSATGSRNSPNAEPMFQRRAMKPSSQSVIAAAMKMIAAATFAPMNGE